MTKDLININGRKYYDRLTERQKMFLKCLKDHMTWYMKNHHGIEINEVIETHIENLILIVFDMYF